MSTYIDLAFSTTVNDLFGVEVQSDTSGVNDTQ